MWQKRQAELLKKEIEALLSPLSGTPGLIELVKMPLNKARRGLADEAALDRPWSFLSLMVCEAVCGHCEQALPTTAAIQLLMASGDVFDDVEDADAPESLPGKYGPAVAINVATILISLAERAGARLIEKGVKNEVVIRVMDVLNSSFTDACAGQHMDLTFSSELKVSEEDYLRAVGLKSASQVECACHIGALLGGTSQKTVAIFVKFGYNLGMAAQIGNDIKGIIDGSDLLKPKITLPYVYALSQTEGESQNYLKSLFSKRPDKKPDVPRIRDILFPSGAVHYATIKLESYKQMALEALSEAEKAGVNTERLKVFLK
jgi:geranylgeranyl pyrophosphate synthase